MVYLESVIKLALTPKTDLFGYHMEKKKQNELLYGSIQVDVRGFTPGYFSYTFRPSAAGCVANNPVYIFAHP